MTPEVPLPLTPWELLFLTRRLLLLLVTGDSTGERGAGSAWTGDRGAGSAKTGERGALSAKPRRLLLLLVTGDSTGERGAGSASTGGRGTLSAKTGERGAGESASQSTGELGGDSNSSSILGCAGGLLVKHIGIFFGRPGLRFLPKGTDLTSDVASRSPFLYRRPTVCLHSLPWNALQY